MPALSVSNQSHEANQEGENSTDLQNNLANTSIDPFSKSFTHSQASYTSPFQGKVSIGSVDLHNKLSKKIAQLTKVIYHLNSKNEDHQLDLDICKEENRNEINNILTDASKKINKFKEQLEIKKIETNAEFKLKKFQEKYDEEKRQAIDDMSRYKTQCEKQLKDLKSQHCVELQKLNSDLISKKFQIETNINKCIETNNQLKDLYKEKIDKIEKDHAAINEKSRKHLAEKVHYYETKLRDLEISHSETLKQKEIRHQEHTQTKLKIADENKNIEIGKIRAELGAKEQENMLQFKREKESIIRKFEDDILHKEEEFTEKYNSLREEFTSTSKENKTLIQSREKEIEQLVLKLTNLETETIFQKTEIETLQQEKKGLLDEINFQKERELELENNTQTLQKASDLNKSEIDKLKNTIATKESKIKEVNTLIDKTKKDFEKQLQSQQVQTKTLKEEMVQKEKDFKLKLQKKENDLQTLHQKSQKLEEAKALQEAFLRDKEVLEAGERQKMEVQISKLEKENRSLLSSGKDATKSITELQSSIESLKNEIKKQNAQIHTLEKVKMAQANEILEKKKLLMEEKENMTRKESIEKSLTDHVNSLKKKIEEKDEEMKDKSNRFISDKNQSTLLLEAKNNEIEALKQQINKFQEDNEAFEQTEEELRKKILHEEDCKKKEIAILKGQLNDRSQDYENICSDYEKKIFDLRSKFEANLLTENKNYEELQNNFNSFKIQSEEKYNSLISTKEDQLTQVKQNHAKTKLKYEEIIQEKEKDFNMLQKKLQSSIELFRKELSEQENNSNLDKNDLQIKLDNLKKQNSDYKEAKEAAQTEILKLKQAIEVSIKEKLVLSTDIENLNGKVSDKVKVIHEYLNKCNSLEKKIDVMQNENRKDKELSLSNLIKLQEEKKKLETKILDYKEVVSDLKEKQQEMELTHIETMDMAKLKYEEEQEQSQNAHQQKVNEISSAFNDEIERINVRNREKELSFNQTIEDLRDNYHKLKVKFENRESRVEDLQQINALSEKIKSLEKERKQANDQMMYFKLELINREENYNKVFSRSPNVGNLMPFHINNNSGG